MFHLPSDKWLSAWYQWFNSKTHWNEVPATPGLDNMVQFMVICLRSRNVRNTGGKWNESGHDDYLTSSSNDMLNADWDSCCGVAMVNVQQEYRWLRGEYSSIILFLYSRCSAWMVSIAEKELSSPPSFSDPGNSHSEASSKWFRNQLNLDHYNEQSGQDIQQCYLMNCDNCPNCTQSSSHSNAEIPFTHC